VSGGGWKRTFRLEPFGGGLDDALDEELSFHLEERIDQLMADGLDETEARSQAERDLGRVEEHRRRARVVDGRRARRIRRRIRLDSLVLDTRQAVRGLRRTPGFTILALLLIAVGIGTTTTIFSLTRQVLIDPLPFTDPDRLLRVWERCEARGWNYSSLAEPTFIDLRDRNRSFSDFGAYTAGNMVLTGDGDPLQLRAGLASVGFFRALDLQPVLGRLFTTGEDADGTPAEVVLLSHALWQSRFGKRPDIVGEPVILSGQPYTVVGVLPAGEFYLDSHDLWIPLGADPAGRRDNHILWAVGRLRTGVTVEKAQADLDALARQVATENAMEDKLSGVSLIPLSRNLIGDDTRTAMGFLLAAVGLVLLIACANLASMLLARGTRRRQEIAVTAALGAGRGRITQQVLTESSLLSIVGGVLGVSMAVGLIHLLKVLGPSAIPRLTRVTVDHGVLGFALGITFLVAVLAGAVPAFQAPRIRLNEVLQGGTRAGGGRRRDRLRTLLVMTEIALSTVLLIGSGLMIRSLLGVQGADRGFQVEDRVLFDVTIPESHYGEVVSRSSFFEEFTAGIEAIPVVRSVGAVSASPLDGLSTNMGILRLGQVLDPAEEMPLADWRHITPGYFEALGRPLLQGRVFQDMSVSEAAPFIDLEKGRFELNVVISESVAGMLWPEGDPIGRQVQLWAEPDEVGTVIGVVGDMRERGLEDDPRQAVYLSYTIGIWNPVTFVVHTDGDPVGVLPAIRRLLGRVDPDLPISNIRRLDELLGATMGSRRFNTLLLTFFAAVALFLACSGLYGIVAYTVTERDREIGVRMALGASPSVVLGLFLRQGLLRILPALVLGLAAAVGLSRLIQSVLYRVSPLDAVTYAGVALILTATAVLAVLLPARRAVRVDPVSVLRQQ
jgi:putative ABC transport system permease protein